MMSPSRSSMFYLIAIFLVSFVGVTGLSGEQNIAEITVQAGEVTRQGIPLSMSLEGFDVDISKNTYYLLEISGDTTSRVPAQIEQTDPPRLWWIVNRNIPAGEKRTYELVSGQKTDGAVMGVSMAEDGLDIRKGPRKALRYNYGIIPPPEVNSELYKRSGFIHPVWTPSGKVLTRIHPSDHIHHLGFWNPWTKTEFEGRKVDFWNLGKGQGTVRFVKFTDIAAGPVFGGFTALHEYVDLSSPWGEKVALKEKWTARVWNVNEGIWLWDFTTEQWAASSSPLQILQHRYGGFGFRGTADWNKDNSNYLTSEGRTREDGNGTRARWCMVHGITDSGPAGAIFMNHPENREFPEPMRIWPRGDVFFGFCPVVNSGFTIKPGELHTRKYRIFVYDGEIAPEKAEQIWRNFGNPPVVTVNK